MNESGRFMLDIQCYFISTQQWYHYTFHMKWLHIIKKVHIYHLLAQLRPNNNTFETFFRRYDIIIWMIFNSVHIVRVWLNRMFHSMLYLSTLHTIYTTTVYLSTQFGWYRVSHNIGSTLFFDIFSGSGAHTEELLTIFQQPWKFAIW